jgi:Xaa-Pro aminopeptidase
MKLPRIVGVSVVFQRRLVEYSPKLCRKLLADSALRRVFYDLARQQPSAEDAFDQRYIMLRQAAAIVDRSQRAQLARKAEVVDGLKLGKKNKELRQTEKAVELAKQILEDAQRAGKRRLTQEELKIATRKQWVEERDSKLTTIEPLSVHTIVKTFARSKANLPRSFYANQNK